ncbi:MAG TPA: protein phosphatase 2C domain-containing protein, partial [Chroococcales cyanobacterium]
MEKLTWQVVGLTDKGLVRSDNQDNFSVSSDSRVFVVADGMGGTAGGALASKLAVEEMEICRKEKAPDLSDHESVHKWLVDSIARANKKVKENAEKSKESSKMGTTIVAAVQSDDDTLHIAHVGDSRAYLVRDDSGKLLTLDHSVVMEFYRRGQITMAQVQSSP